MVILMNFFRLRSKTVRVTYGPVRLFGFLAVGGWGSDAGGLFCW